MAAQVIRNLSSRGLLVCHILRCHLRLRPGNLYRQQASLFSFSSESVCWVSSCQRLQAPCSSGTLLLHCLRRPL